MATWVVHMMVVDKLFELGLRMDEKGFSVGNIAPDCNVENEDWTVFTPPKEVTHWMNGESKLSADYEGFYNEYLNNDNGSDDEKVSFLWGYFSHLIVDVEFQKFVRDEKRVEAIFSRIHSRPDLAKKVADLPENFDTIKAVFGKNNVFGDILQQELNYLDKNTDSRYNTILKETDLFPDYIDYLPEGAINRKLRIIADYFGVETDRSDFVFFSENELNSFVQATGELIYSMITNRLDKRDSIAIF